VGAMVDDLARSGSLRGYTGQNHIWLHIVLVALDTRLSSMIARLLDQVSQLGADRSAIPASRRFSRFVDAEVTTTFLPLCLEVDEGLIGELRRCIVQLARVFPHLVV